MWYLKRRRTMDFDFLIIGGGIAGVSCAARLQGAGKVLLLEAEDALAHHASGRSAALYEPRYGLAPVVALSMASGAYFHALPDVLSPRGMMIVGKAEDAAQFEADATGMELTPISVDAAREIVPILNPDTVAHVALADHAWDIDTDLLLQGFARQARAGGAEILTKAPVSAISREGGGWVVTTPKGSFSTRVIINAAGAWADLVAGMAGVSPLGFTPLRRSMARIPAPGGHDISRWPMIFGCGETWYCKPDAGALIVSPAEEDLTVPHDAFADDMVLAEGLARFEEMTNEPVTRLLANWAGLRTFSPDRVPVIGFDSQTPGFFWLAGQGGYGFQSAPAASELAADILQGRSSALGSEIIAALNPARFDGRA
jgi:D-arginine dehydrogenase